MRTYCEQGPSCFVERARKGRKVGVPPRCSFQDLMGSRKWTDVLPSRPRFIFANFGRISSSSCLRQTHCPYRSIILYSPVEQQSKTCSIFPAWFVVSFYLSLLLLAPKVSSSPH
ncbi:hypothetical protein CDAR_518121 [Caerostris darwini]|uniref:Uncharacterized protein n=1 Tax=Caerostris darwini TaxID=1538125 RepID=A0AAV4VGX7_9ARAC|nr:hypothetical protein CDAR_518121 [Caerostris darwini]